MKVARNRRPGRASLPDGDKPRLLSVDDFEHARDALRAVESGHVDWQGRHRLLTLA